MKATEDPMVAPRRECVSGIDGRHVASVGCDPVSGRHHDCSGGAESLFIEHRLCPWCEAILVRGCGLNVSLGELQRFVEGVAIGLLWPKPPGRDQIGQLGLSFRHRPARAPVALGQRQLKR